LYQETKEEIKALPNIQEYLIDNPEDIHGRNAYLGLVKRAGTLEQKNKAISDTEIWLSDNPKDSYVRKTFLNLIRRVGTPEQKDKAISDTKIWLSNNPKNSYVRKQLCAKNLLRSCWAGWNTRTER